MKNAIKGVLLGTAAVVMASCCGEGRKTKVMELDNQLTQQQKDERRFTPEVMWKMGRIGAPVLSPDGKTVLYTVTYYNMDENKGLTSIFSLPVAGGEAVKLTDNEGNATDPVWIDGKIYFMSDRGGSSQLWSMAADGSLQKQVSDIEGGIEAYGIAGDRIFYVKSVQVDKRRSADIYADMGKSQALIYDDLMARHWNRWTDGSYLHIFVADFAGNKITNAYDIMEGESWDAPMSPYFDASEISWNNGGTQLAYTCKKMTGTQYAVSTDSDIYLYDVASKTTANLTEGMVGYDKYPRFSPDDAKIAFTSMRRPGNESDKSRLFVIDLKSGAKKYLTSDFDFNAENVLWADSETIYFISPIAATHQVCRVSEGKPVEVLTEGDHDIVALTMAGGESVVAMQSITQASELYRLKDGALSQISFVNKGIYDNMDFGNVEKRWVRTSDNKQMLTWVITPPNFDPQKKYPVLLYCQGGPQSVVSQFWSYRWNFQLMAAQGYVIVAPNRRGLPSFGQEWLDQISGDYSGQNIRDYLSAIDDVAREPWADADRMGCVGASYGGYSVYYLAGHHDKRFKAFISHCGIFDFDSMYGETEELFFVNNDYGGPYWDKSNATAQRSYANSPHKSVQKWDTPILIFTGLNDFRIPYTQSLEAFTAARVLGLPSRLVAFENEAHQVFKPQNSIVWNREFFDWLDRYVKNGEKWMLTNDAQLPAAVITKVADDGTVIQ